LKDFNDSEQQFGAHQNKTMRCEADVTFIGTSRVAADQAIVVETQAALFANFLCNPHLGTVIEKRAEKR
jgi:hypothetical protein